MTWIHHAPKIKLLGEIDKKEPYPLSWDEQTQLFNELPPHLKGMALFAVNTGCRGSGGMWIDVGDGSSNTRVEYVGLHHPLLIG